MTRLTEEMVIARSKLSDLSQIKKLNCWGTELSDVSILRKMRGVEVLALSVNQITTLQDFIYCTKLQELYLRRNKIDDLNELAYLQSLPALKYLWLEENPCVDRYKDNYRNIVIRMLPNLEKLDNQEITPQEREKAYSDNGYEPAREDDGGASAGYGYDSYEQEPQQTSPQQSAQSQREQYEMQQQREQQQQQQQEQQRRAYAQSQKESGELFNGKDSSMESTSETALTNNCSKTPSPLQEQMHPPSPKYAYEQAMKESRIQAQQYDRSPGSDQESPQMPMREAQPQQHQHPAQQRQQPMPSSMSTHSMKEYYQSERPAYPVQYRHSQTDLTEWDEHQHQQHYGSTAQLPQQSARASTGDRFGSRVSSVRENGECDDPERPPRPRRIDPRHENVFNHHFSACHRRPVNRNSNILSATLCLLKELDYNSLEVVEHAVRCRFDELSIE